MVPPIPPSTSDSSTQLRNVCTNEYSSCFNLSVVIGSWSPWLIPKGKAHASGASSNPNSGLCLIRDGFPPPVLSGGGDDALHASPSGLDAMAVLAVGRARRK